MHYQSLFLWHLTVCLSRCICSKEFLKGLGTEFASSNHPNSWKIIQFSCIFNFLKKRKRHWKFHKDLLRFQPLLILLSNEKLEKETSMSNTSEIFKSFFLYFFCNSFKWINSFSALKTWADEIGKTSVGTRLGFLLFFLHWQQRSPAS